LVQDTSHPKQCHVTKQHSSNSGTGEGHRRRNVCRWWNGFTVFKGSQAIGKVRDCTPRRGKWIINLREDLEGAGVLIKDHENLEFSQDYEFSSPSAAAGVIRGGNANGLPEWRLPDGKKLKELKAAV
jgi:hypothetical protein